MNPPVTHPAMAPAMMYHWPGMNSAASSATIPATAHGVARRGPRHKGTSTTMKNSGITKSIPKRFGSLKNMPNRKPACVPMTQISQNAMPPPSTMAASAPPEAR